MKTTKSILLLILCTFVQMEINAQVTIIERGFLYDTEVPPTCHAATVVENDNGDLYAAFFGGTYEGHPDSDVWLCKKMKGSTGWTEPTILCDAVYTKFTRSAFEYDPLFDQICHRDSMFEKTTWLETAKHNGKALINNKVRKPCYNPVLYKNADGEIILDYKIGSNMQDWTGWEIRSKNGKKWTHPRALTNDPEMRHLTLGPIKNKPIVSQGRIIAGSSTEVTYDSWKVHFEISDNDGKDWRKVEVKCDTILCIQPTILNLGNGHLKALCRTRHHRIAMTESFDNGSSWTDMRITDMPNNNSGIDAVTLRDGRHLLIGNLHGNDARRSPITIAISNDGDSWTNLIDLEEDDGMEYSYPCIIETSDGRIVVLYTWHRKKIAYAILKI